MNVLSLGAGVQSTTMALMAAKGEIEPMPDCAIFADTMAEPEAVYKHLDWLETQLPFPVYRVSKGSLYKDIKNGGRFASIPFFIKKPDATQAILRRQCTSEYKIIPIQKEVRRLLGYKKGQRIPAGAAVMWIGISLDEIQRMKLSRDRWIENRWPLVEARMTRHDCLNWLGANGYPEPKRSACTFCPYRSDSGWKDMRDNNPKEFAQAIEIDELTRHTVAKNEVYLHRSLIPLAEVDFENDIDKGQDVFGFWNECEGMCGV